MTSRTEGRRSETVTVLLADNHCEYRHALKRTLELEDDINVIGEADNWFELEEMVARQHPHVVLMDLDVINTGVFIREQGSPSISVLPSQAQHPPHNLSTARQQPGSGGHIESDVTGIGRVINNCCDTAVIVLTMWNNVSTFTTAIKSGARGYMLKEIHSDELVNTIRAIAGGETFAKHILTAPAVRLEMPFAFGSRSEISTPLTPALSHKTH